MDKKSEENKDFEKPQGRAIEFFDGEMLQSVENLRQDFLLVNRRAKKVLGAIGVKYKDLKQYMQDSRNFTTNEWEFLEQGRKEAREFKSSMLRALGVDVDKKAKEVRQAVEKQKAVREEAKEKKSKLKAKLAARKKQDKASSKRRKKTIGLKNRWMQM
jgi:hypothetical protein